MFVEMMEITQPCLYEFIEANSQQLMDEMVSKQRTRISALKRTFYPKTSLIKTSLSILMWYIIHRAFQFCRHSAQNDICFVVDPTA